MTWGEKSNFKTCTTSIPYNRKFSVKPNVLNAMPLYDDSMTAVMINKPI